ncbi:MAG: AMP-binding protein [Actinobacteria bacterium]|nr:AMP-binding protein [Actinomycetota bacterium]
MTLVSYPRALADLASANPDRPAVTDDHRSVTRSELLRESTRLARRLLELGATEGSFVTICLPNSVEFMESLVACWMIGAIPQPVSSKLPDAELLAIIELADPAVVIGREVEGRASLANPEGVAHEPAADGSGQADASGSGQTDSTDEPLPDVVSPSWKAPTSGGSTGRPKLIVCGEKALTDDEATPAIVARRDGALLMPGPLYHNGPLSWASHSLLSGGHVIVMERFDAARTLELIDEHRVDTVYLVPTMMRRISRLPEEARTAADLSSLRMVWHLAEPCPEWLKQEWIDWLGADKIWELYGGTENQAMTIIVGNDWLQHRGSVGRPVVGEMCILDADHRPVPPGTVGEIFMRRKPGGGRTYRYVGAEATVIDGGWESLGDMGSMDADGFLYLADRKTDMILSGGANIYPAEVEMALTEHPDVAGAAVIGLPSDDLGNTVHAIVQLDEDVTIDSESGMTERLVAFLSERLVRYKVPRSFEYTHDVVRDEAGKVRRSQLRADRITEE